MVTITQTFYPRTRAAWRVWLQKNHAKSGGAGSAGKSEIWLVRYKKPTHKPTVNYQDSVDEALCFGWIDGFEKSIDREKYATRFTPRSQKSSWSEGNVKRYHLLVREGLMTAAGTKAFKNKVNVSTQTMLPGGSKWHDQHPMPKHPTLPQRIAWHRQHQKYCGCRPIPKSLFSLFTPN